ncbi:hypothetical protein BDN71DRAFT_1433914 [Pleurotus eryngii]|uniref:Uncharacterized protein n=1 Tax=Pleurotus eryngii TaxID=5323 RepID=A0A9P5ZTE5_PLEER|nr:hypothetical protein BDN71DRAFT_1433914 [Pleurotus eryngii]
MQKLLHLSSYKTTTNGQPFAEGLDKKYAPNFETSAILICSQLEQYKVASFNSRIKGREAVDAIVNDYFKIFDWRLPVTQEPEDGAPPPNLILEASLPPEEERVKQQVVAHMKQVHDAALEFQSPAGFIIGLHESTMDYRTSLATPPLTPPPSSLHYAKQAPSELKQTFENEFATSGQPKNNCANACNKYMLAHFKSLLPDVQESWAVKAKDCLDHIGDFFYPILDGVHDLLHMHVTVMIGGPEPVKGGQLNVLSLHSGKNLDAIPKTWGDADPQKYKAVTTLFQEYLQMVYTPAQQLKVAMLHTLSSSTALFDSSGTVNDTLDERTRHKEHRGETHSGNNVKRTDAPDERTQRKENKREACDGKDIERKDPTKHKRKPNKPQKSKRPSSDSESAVTSDTETDDSSSEDETPPRKRHVEGKGNRRQSKYDSSSDLEDSNDGNSTPTPITSDSVINSAITRLSQSPDLPSQYKILFAIKGVLTVWFRLLSVFSHFEASTEFENLSAKLPTLHRPEEIAWWVNRARKAYPMIHDVDAFSTKWWQWWIAMQPEWRKIKDNSLTMERRHCAFDKSVSCAIDAWDKLDRPGQNGFLNLICCLGWWAEERVKVLQAEAEAEDLPCLEDWTEKCEDGHDWLMGVANLIWAMECLMASHKAVTDLNTLRPARLLVATCSKCYTFLDPSLCTVVHSKPPHLPKVVTHVANDNTQYPMFKLPQHKVPWIYGKLLCQHPAYNHLTTPRISAIYPGPSEDGKQQVE